MLVRRMSSQVDVIQGLRRVQDRIEEAFVNRPAVRHLCVSVYDMSDKHIYSMIKLE